MTTILIGTSGYSYQDWIGEFYPVGTKRQDMLAYYADRFPLVELDYTYYRMPDARTMAGMASKTPAGFLFAVKAFQDLTHRRDLDGAELARLTQEFSSALDPLTDSNKLACVLAQFPWSFRPSSENYEFLAEMQASLPGKELVIEFRNAEWISDQTFSFLGDFGLGFCCVDEPKLRGLLPPLSLSTSGTGYVRFHGRNAAKWWRHDHAWERYNYDYSRAELEEWLPRLQGLSEQTDRTMVLMNNCHAGNAVRNAIRLRALLEQSGLL